MILARTLVLLAILAPLAACDSGPPTPTSRPAAPAVVAAAGAMAPMLGTWAENLEWCTPGRDGAPTLISEAAIEGPGQDCSITSFADNGDGSFTAGLSCRNPGHSMVETAVLTPSGDSLRISYPQAGGEPETLARCP